ncbi:S8 family serine peptidase [candidate division KSB1 bacterium]
MKYKSLSYLLVLTTLIVSVGLAADDVRPGSKVSPALGRLLPRMGLGETIKVWVFFKDGSGPLHQPAKLHQLLAGVGRLKYLSRWLNAASLEVSVGDIQRLASLDFVRRLQPVRTFTRPRVPTAALARQADSQADTSGLFERYGFSASQLVQIGVPTLHDRGLYGEGIKIAILDTGFFQDHEAVAACSVAAQWDFIDGDDNTQDDTNYTSGETPYDTHGTAVWSILAGNQPGILVGPAYKAEFLLARSENEDYEIRSEEDWYVAALEWADSLGAHIVSSSLGYLDFDDGFAYSYDQLNGDFAVTTVAADIAASRGMLVIASVGNDGPDPGTLGSPADGDSVVAVGAVKYTGERADFSSLGPTADGRIKPDLAALGSNTYAANASNPTAYYRVDGTSAAAPLVAGLAALVWQANPEWDAMQVREALTATASQADQPDNELGWGIPDGPAAVEYTAWSVQGVKLVRFNAVNRGDRVLLQWDLFDWTSVTSVRLLRQAGNEGPFIDITPDNFIPGPTTFVDSLVQRNQVYGYRLEMVDRFSMHHEFGPVSVKVLPLRFNLAQNYPNPFNAGTVIEFHLPDGLEGEVKLAAYNILGREVKSLLNENLLPGAHRVEFNGTDDRGSELPSGVYFYRLWVNGKPGGTRRMVLVR